MNPVLVVDDDIQMLAALEAAIRQKGFRVETASNGGEAMRKFESSSFAGVITDLRMPGVDGLELLQHIRRTNPEMPVVVLSAFGTVPDAVLALKAGAANFLMKPFSHDALDETLRSFRPQRVSKTSPEVEFIKGRSVSEMERKLILTTLDQTNGNRTHASKLLGISLRTLRNKLREYRLEEATVSPTDIPPNLQMVSHGVIGQ